MISPPGQQLQGLLLQNCPHRKLIGTLQPENGTMRPAVTGYKVLVHILSKE